jgi:hypothetical protein
MIELYKTLNKLSRLDLTKYPVKEIENYLGEIGTIAQIGYTLHPGNSVLRARPNKSDDETFNTRSQLKYRPQQFNTTFQRASTPYETMFYGSVVPERTAATDIDNARAIACFESASTFRNNFFSSIEKITFSRWEVTEDINLVMVAYSPNYLREGSILTELNQSFQKEIGLMDPDLLKRSLVANEFLSQQFSKQTIRDDFDYLISAIYTDQIVKRGFDGVFYPSVKADGRGYNVCLTKNCTDKKLKLYAAGEGKIIKCGYKTEVINLAQVLVEDETKEFDFSPIAQASSAEEIWLKLLNE